MMTSHYLTTTFLSLICKFFCICFPAASQNEVSLIKKVQLKGEVEQVSTDRYGNWYAGTSGGFITKYNAAGEELEIFSSEKPGEITLLEAWNSISIFAFFQGFQEYLLLNRFLSPAKNLAFSIDDRTFVQMAAPASDGNIWVFDQTGYQLLKYSNLLSTEVFGNPLDLNLPVQSWDIRYMREYQNQLYLADHQNGIHVFDLMGNWQQTIPGQGIDWFGFSGDEAYFLKANHLELINPYDGQKRELDLPEEGLKRVVLTEGLLICFKGQEASIYSFK